MFRQRQQLRRWAARVLLVWLFSVGAGAANACITTGPVAPVVAVASHLVAVADAHHNLVSHDHVQAEGASLPDEADLRFAASIAAFYSKARDGSVVDVSHTPARHVKKPRGAPPGLVTLLQEAVVRVRPDDAAAVAAAAEGGEEDE